MFSKVVVNDVEYNSIEQYTSINARKAVHFHDKAAEKTIMAISQSLPIGVKWVRVHGFDKEEWTNAVREILFDRLFAKVRNL